MSVESCTAFLEQAREDPDLGELLRAVTDTRELVVLGHRSGYRFEAGDLATAASALARPADAPAKPDATPATQIAGGESAIYHYELDLLALPELAPILDELPHLTIKPATVDLDEFAAAFRREDLEWTAMSPADPGFQGRYEQVMASHWSGGAGGRRDFHLVNLDQHVDHPLYDRYLQAKVRTIRHLSDVFACDIRFSGSMWYPPLSYRLWHTNESQPGWRMYLIDLDTAVADADMSTFFRYMNPATKQVVTLQDRPKLLRFFKIDQRSDALFWHCIVNRARRDRWSFGFVIPDDWMTRLRTTHSPDALGNHRI
jgi:predicted ribosomally synthesized peptide with nif11-like leader